MTNGNKTKANEFIAKLKKDPKLMDSLLKDPVSTVKAEGISLTPEQEKSLKSLSKEELKAIPKITGEGCSYNCG
ncbi:MAG TPA: hypothetical protein VGK06_12220 [Methanosarcina sp.]|jgi:hypothetical protein